MIKLLVGLGNPGLQYRDNRHNAGFWWIDALAHTLRVQLRPERTCNALLARTTVNGCGLWLMQPQTFMNRSGAPVAALARFFKIAPHETLVVHDELDFAPGQVRLKCGGSHGGHNGLRDISAQWGSSPYWRLRLGIGHPGQRDAVTGWVLGNPPPAQRRQIEEAIAHSLNAWDALHAGDMEKAMRLIHTRA